MARARMLKPGFFRNEELAELPMTGRLLFAGLWTLADKAGRLLDRPKRIKADLFPFDDDLDVDGLLDTLAAKSFIERYEVDGIHLIQVCKFLDHQKPHPREAESLLPGIPSNYSKPRQRQTQGEPLQGEPKPRRPESFPSESCTSESESGIPRQGAPVPSEPVGPTRLPRGGVMGGMLPRDHVDHASCSPCFSRCVPNAIHRELVRLLSPAHGGDRDKAGARLLEWYPTVWAQLKPSDVVGDAFKFWCKWFDLTFTTAAAPVGDRAQASTPRSTVPNAEATRAYLRKVAE